MSLAQAHEGSIAFWAIFLATLIGGLVMAALDTEGASSLYNATDTSHPMYYNTGADFTHTKDDYIVFAYPDSDGNLICAYRKSTSDTWLYAEIASRDRGGNDQDWYTVGVRMIGRWMVLRWVYSTRRRYHVGQPRDLNDWAASWARAHRPRPTVSRRATGAIGTSTAPSTEEV